ncbi:phage distal tail protein [Halobacillus salinus]|uniref:Phage tail family protein n=1 Tax=Halobacillus salinus TaxID=192814 RepID=A0A4Z0H483_9BACI|nr:phage tail domain-containing protein [Halobacillus salinus]TGB04687.1 phage tail family protein [Halobacillus salinus]
MKSEKNFHIEYPSGVVLDMHEDLGVWVSSFNVSPPTVKRSMTEAAGMDGARVTRSKLDVRKVEIGLQVESESVVELDDLKHKLYGVFFSREAYTIRLDYKPDWEIYAMQDGGYEFDYITQMDGGFLIELVMPDPYIYSVEQEQIVDASGDPTITIPALFAAQETPIVRPGTNAESPFIAEITFTDPGTEYVLKHVQSGRYIRLLFGFTSGDKLRIYSNWKTDTGQSVRKIELNGERNMTMLDIVNSAFFWLGPGGNTFEVLPSTGVKTKIKYRERWL